LAELYLLLLLRLEVSISNVYDFNKPANGYFLQLAEPDILNVESFNVMQYKTELGLTNV